METNVNYTIVGIFIIGLVAAIVVAILWLSSGLTFEHYSTYMVYMQESVSGLSTDSPVEFNGVQIGTVKTIELDRQNPHLVELLLDIKSNTPITQGTVATLNSRGVTGITFVALKDDGNDVRPLKAAYGQPYPIIKTAPSLFLRLDTALSSLSSNFSKLTDSIEGLLDKENLQSIKGILHSMQLVTDNLAANNKKLDAILVNTEKASLEFTPLLQTSTGAMKLLQTQTLPTAYQTLTNLDNLLRTVGEFANNLKQNPSILIRGAAPLAPGPGETP